MYLSDNPGSVGFEEQVLQIYNVVADFPRMYDFFDNVQMALTYERSLDLLIVKRKVYGLLDLLGDVGGLASSLKSLFFSLILVFQYKAALTYVSNHTYKVERDSCAS